MTNYCFHLPHTVPLPPTTVTPALRHLPRRDTGHKDVGAARMGVSRAGVADASVGEGMWLPATGQGWDGDAGPAPAPYGEESLP